MSMPAPYLDPLNQALADQLATQPALQDLSVSQFRALFEQLQEHQPLAGVTRTSFTVPSEHGVEAFVFKSKHAAKADLPVIFYLHGGAWISGSVNSYDSICRELALQTGFAVVFPEYTLAPEARYPTQQNQCYAVVKHIHSHGHAMGLSQSAFAIVGDSAGAQLSVATIIRCVTHTPRIAIKFQVLLSPVTDTVTSDRDTRSEFTFFNGPLLTVPFLRKSICAYIPNPADRISELASPRNISPRNARRQPPTLIVNSSADPLRDDGVLFGEILQRAGVDAVIVTGHGQLHDSAVLEATRGGATPRFVVRAVAEAVVDALSGEEKGVVDRKVGGGKRKKGVEEGERVVEQNKRRTSTRTRGM